jgi:hypothetical protein
VVDLNPAPVRLICAITYSPKAQLDDVLAHLEYTFGSLDDKSKTIEFTHTEYYTPEMGPGLKKLLVDFERPFNPGNLWLAKRSTCDIESMHMDNGKRKVNLDPGYVEPSKLVLASTKNFSHRVYLNEGIYAEVTMLYSGDRFQKLPWTYPDYLEPDFQTFLELVRGKSKKAASEA